MFSKHTGTRVGSLAQKWWRGLGYTIRPLLLVHIHPPSAFGPHVFPSQLPSSLPSCILQPHLGIFQADAQGQLC